MPHVHALLQHLRGAEEVIDPVEVAAVAVEVAAAQVVDSHARIAHRRGEIAVLRQLPQPQKRLLAAESGEFVARIATKNGCVILPEVSYRGFYFFVAFKNKFKIKIKIKNRIRRGVNFALLFVFNTLGLHCELFQHAGVVNPLTSVHLCDLEALQNQPSMIFKILSGTRAREHPEGPVVR